MGTIILNEKVISSGIGIQTHKNLLDRDLTDQHPIEAISGLSDELNNKQEKLISGTNIKKLNGNDLIGDGDLQITNIETANSLKTARAINGVKFDGSSDIEVPIKTFTIGTITNPLTSVWFKACDFKTNLVNDNTNLLLSVHKNPNSSTMVSESGILRIGIKSPSPLTSVPFDQSDNTISIEWLSITGINPNHFALSYNTLNGQFISELWVQIDDFPTNYTFNVLSDWPLNNNLSKWTFYDENHLGEIEPSDELVLKMSTNKSVSNNSNKLNNASLKELLPISTFVDSGKGCLIRSSIPVTKDCKLKLEVKSYNGTSVNNLPVNFTVDFSYSQSTGFTDIRSLNFGYKLELINLFILSGYVHIWIPEVFGNMTYETILKSSETNLNVIDTTGSFLMPTGISNLKTITFNPFNADTVSNWELSDINKSNFYYSSGGGILIKTKILGNNTPCGFIINIDGSLANPASIPVNIPINTKMTIWWYGTTGQWSNDIRAENLGYPLSSVTAFVLSGYIHFWIATPPTGGTTYLIEVRDKSGKNIVDSITYSAMPTGVTYSQIFAINNINKALPKVNGEVIFSKTSDGLTPLQTFSSPTSGNSYLLNIGSTFVQNTSKAPKLLNYTQQELWQGSNYQFPTSTTINYPGGSMTLGPANGSGTRFLENAIMGQIHSYRIDVGFVKAAGTSLTVGVALYNPISGFVRRYAVSAASGTTNAGFTIDINGITADANSIGNGYIMIIQPYFTGGSLTSLSVYNIKQISHYTTA